MIRLTTLSSAVATLLLFAAIPSVHAMSWSRIGDIAEIAKTSAAGFQGTVIERSFREIDVNGNPFPYTETTFQINDCFYGCPADNEIVIRQMGGDFLSRKDYAMLVPGLAQYEIGRDYFVFAGGAKDDLFGSRFGEHGSLPLVKLEQGGPSVVVDHAGAMLQLTEDRESVNKNGLRCHALDADNVCTAVSGTTKESTAADGVSADDFARFVRSITTDKSQPARAISDRHDFETALAAYAGLRK